LEIHSLRRTKRSIDHVKILIEGHIPASVVERWLYDVFVRGVGEAVDHGRALRSAPLEDS
jgi:hypothetical protein